MINRIRLNNDWLFAANFEEKEPDVMDSELYDNYAFEQVRLPHCVCETPLHYFDEHAYQMVSCYRKNIEIPETYKGKKLLLTFEGAAHRAVVYINGVKTTEHNCGYTAFTVDITELVEYGQDNEIAVWLDSRETLNIPPFGFVIDYMTYGGIYRDVYLDVKERTYIEDIFVTTKLAEKQHYGDRSICLKSAVISEIEINNWETGLTVSQYFGKKDSDALIMLGQSQIERGKIFDVKYMTGQVELWDTDNPALYQLVTKLTDKEGNLLDEKTVIYGYRRAVFKKDGFYLNGKKTKIRGLNRHQSYAYTGYAMPKSMQQFDADILKNELGLNAVRTSHYPQSQYFIDRCDELGLLVFTEFPGWQHIGNKAWKKQAIKNAEEMIVQYRNHPSIILWGVRINESVDDDEFYEETNLVAKACDSSRATGGVRCYKKSSLLEDVYTYNDFVHTGKNKGCDKKSAVTSDMEKPYLISEYMGHMYPTKAFDWEEHRLEHAIRHANVLDSVAAEKDIAGCFGWCMFDYNTHKDFGSGDRICYHGVMDMFRNPKLAAAVYAMQQDKIPVLEISSSMDIGEHPGCNRNETYIFTNADAVRMYKNDYFIKEYTHADSHHKNMKTPPIRIDDYIGDSLQELEHMSAKQADDVKAVLNEVARHGLYQMSKLTYARAAKMMLMYGMKMDDAVALYNKYIGDWGGKATIYRFDGVKDGKVVKSVTKAAMTKVRLEVSADHTELKEGDCYDVAAVRIRATDEYGNTLYYCNDSVNVTVKGSAELIGPSSFSLSGGMTGFYVKTTGRSGRISVVVSLPQYGISETIEMNISK